MQRLYTTEIFDAQVHGYLGHPISGVYTSSSSNEGARGGEANLGVCAGTKGAQRRKKSMSSPSVDQPAMDAVSAKHK